MLTKTSIKLITYTETVIRSHRTSVIESLKVNARMDQALNNINACLAKKSN